MALSSDKKRGLPRWIKKISSVLVLIAILQPEPAHAQVVAPVVVVDPANITDEIAEWAKDAYQWLQDNEDWLISEKSKIIDKLQQRISAEQAKLVANGNANMQVLNARMTAAAQDAARAAAEATPSDMTTSCTLTAIVQNENAQHQVIQGIDQAQKSAYLNQGSSNGGLQMAKITRNALAICQKIGPGFTSLNAPYGKVIAIYGGACSGAGTVSP